MSDETDKNSTSENGNLTTNTTIPIENLHTDDDVIGDVNKNPVSTTIKSITTNESPTVVGGQTKQWVKFDDDDKDNNKNRVQVSAHFFFMQHKKINSSLNVHRV